MSNTLMFDDTFNPQVEAADFYPRRANGLGDEWVGLAHGPRSNDSVFGGLDELPEAPKVAVDVPHRATPRSRLVEELLPFTVRIVDNARDLRRVQQLRALAYGRHMPEMAAAFGSPDPIDLDAETTIFFAEDKLSGEVVGSARIQTNRLAPLQIERSVALPPERQGQLLCEITRLSVMPGYTPPVRLALVKASHIYCIAMQIGGVMAGSRRALLRQYRSLGFTDLFEDERMVPLVHAGGLEHRILFRDTVTSEAESRARNHADYPFVFRTYHPDIQVFAPLSASVDRGLRQPHRDASWAWAA